jgi:hypothetical protein
MPYGFHEQNCLHNLFRNGQVMRAQHKVIALGDTTARCGKIAMKAEEKSPS